MNFIIVPHFGVLKKDKMANFFDNYIHAAEAERKLIFDGISRDLSDEEIFQEHKKVYWSGKRGEDKPYPAYKLNTEITIRLTRVDFSENLEYNNRKYKNLMK